MTILRKWIQIDCQLCAYLFSSVRRSKRSKRFSKTFRTRKVSLFFCQDSTKTVCLTVGAFSWRYSLDERRITCRLQLRILQDSPRRPLYEALWACFRGMCDACFTVCFAAFALPFLFFCRCRWQSKPPKRSRLLWNSGFRSVCKERACWCCPRCWSGWALRSCQWSLNGQTSSERKRIWRQ